MEVTTAVAVLAWLQPIFSTSHIHKDRCKALKNLSERRTNDMALKGLDIFKLTPKTNCKECGNPTCMALQ